MVCFRSLSRYLGLLASLSATQALALQPTAAMLKGSFGNGQQIIRPELREDADLRPFELGDELHVESDAVSGAPRIITGPFAHVPRLGKNVGLAAFADLALNVVARHSEVFGVTPADLTLVQDSVLIDADDQFISFDVARHGLRIWDANIDFLFKHGRLTAINTRTFAEAVAADDGASTAPDFAAGEKLDTYYRVVQTGSGYSLKRVNLYEGTAEGERYRFEVDDASGKLFQAALANHYAAGVATGIAYPRTWYKSQLQRFKLGDLSLTVGGQSIMTRADGAFTANSTPGATGLKGKRVNVSARSGGFAKPTVKQTSGVWSVDYAQNAEKSLAQTMAFFHVGRIIWKAKHYVTAPWFERPFTVNVNVSETCNSFWDGVAMFLYQAGDGCANTALISDVIYHEWGHGLDDNSGGIYDDAYSEGFGDIMSMVMNRSSVIALGIAFPSGAGLRDLAPNKIYPKDSGEPHAEGLIIASTFWDLYQYLKAAHGDDVAADLTAKYAFKTIFTARRYTEVYTATLVVDDNDGNLGNKTPNFCTINRAFAEHGLTRKDASCT